MTCQFVTAWRRLDSTTSTRFKPKIQQLNLTIFHFCWSDRDDTFEGRTNSRATQPNNTRTSKQAARQQATSTSNIIILLKKGTWSRWWCSTMKFYETGKKKEEEGGKRRPVLLLGIYGWENRNIPKTASGWNREERRPAKLKVREREREKEKGSLAFPMDRRDQLVHSRHRILKTATCASVARTDGRTGGRTIGTIGNEAGWWTRHR